MQESNRQYLFVVRGLLAALTAALLGGCYLSFIEPLGEVSFDRNDTAGYSQVAGTIESDGEEAAAAVEGEQAESGEGDAVEAPADPDAAHEQLFMHDRFPSAATCATCHPRQYRHWSASPHAYAMMSPVFNAMQATVTKLTNGTNGDFCIRCHTPVGMQAGAPTFAPVSERDLVVREGVTCIVCHRRNEAYGKASGRFALHEGKLFDTVYGPTDNAELDRVITSDEFSVVTEETGIGRPIHGGVENFFQITSPGFCATCHDVTLPTGFRLEEAFSEYKSSPAVARGESCQDCHMGTTPGVAEGYGFGPAAVVGGTATRDRRLANHMVVGPDYSIVHPGLYPLSVEADDLATQEEWLAFDVQAGWGTDDYEDALDEAIEGGLDEDSLHFPDRWATPDDRVEGREVIEEQLALLEEARQRRLALLRRGYLLGDIEVLAANDGGLSFQIEVRNGTDGHNVPTGFTAERLVFLQVVVTDVNGKTVFLSGDLDPNGDVRDLHSVYVHNHELPLDEQLFSLQSRFITRNLRGGEREQILAVNHSLDALPFVRPEGIPSILLGRPQDARIHKQGIEPLGVRRPRYDIDPSYLTGQGPYRAQVRLVAGMVPVNLVSAIKDVGFDYNMSPRDVADAIVKGHEILWEREALLGE